MVKCCDMLAGELNARISISRKTRAGDGMGGSNDIWPIIATPYAKWRAVGGREMGEAMRNTSVNRFRAIIRFKGDTLGAPFYSSEDRVMYRGRVYGIESILDLEDKQKWLVITLVEGKKS